MAFTMALQKAFHQHFSRLLSTSRRMGSYSRMLDMGGAPSSMNDKNATRINASKNCKLQAVCFDFEVLSKYTPKEHPPTAAPSTSSSSSTGHSASSSTTTTKLGQDVKPNVNVVQEVASLLNVDLGGMSAKKKKDEPDDDLSLLMGSQESPPKPTASSSISKNNPFADIRSKYADKLAKRGVQGGLAEVELTKHQVEETLRRGDAGGHLAARKIAAANPVSRQRSWMALTGTGALLQYLTQRSIQIALLPRPSETLNEDEGEYMEDFKRQLHDVNFGHLLKDGRPGAEALVQTVLQKLNLDPTVVLFVSDRDAYLKAAKEANFMTCRILPPNARRGNISAHFMVPDIPAVQEVVDEVNGISFNAVFKSR
eukprot:scaffold5169_cov172-Amphora_coffeaeformis.AAC.9